MTGSLRCILLFIVLTTLSLPAPAQWNGQGELGLVLSRGNSKTETGNLKFNFSADHSAWRHLWGTRLIYGRNNKEPSAEHWDLFAQSEFKFAAKAFTFGSLRYEQDRFSGFAYQATASAGIGYDWLRTTAVTLNATLGGGYRKLLPQRVLREMDGTFISRTQGEEAEDAVAKGGLLYKHQLTSSTVLQNNLLIESGTKNTLAQNDLTLQVAMTEYLALSVGYSVRHNAQPPAGQIETDQLSTVNLVYVLR